MKKYNWNAAFVVLTFFACVGVIVYAATKIDNAVTVSNSVPQDNVMIVLDAGQEAYVVSIVV